MARALNFRTTAWLLRADPLTVAAGAPHAHVSIRRRKPRPVAFTGAAQRAWRKALAAQLHGSAVARGEAPERFLQPHPTLARLLAP
ncbi:MAG: hypothetical protein AB1761_16755 [Pseudomonadota bacterium]